jgi:hypothetical protein
MLIGRFVYAWSLRERFTPQPEEENVMGLLQCQLFITLQPETRALQCA